MPRTFEVTVTETVTYDIYISEDELLDYLLDYEDVPLVLNFGHPEVVAEWLDVDSDLVADGCCDENFTGCEDREIVNVRLVKRLPNAA